MKAINLPEVLIFHKKIVEKTGGSGDIRDVSLIESALSRGDMTFDVKDLYPELTDKIAAITCGLINNHGFVDGNKRIGVSIMLLLLRLNEIDILYKQEELVDLGVGVAKGLIKEAAIKEWILKHKK